MVVAAGGTNHFFHMAAQLEKRGLLRAIFSGYPRFKLRSRGVSPELIRTYPWIHTAYMALGRFRMNPEWVDRQMWFLSHRALDRHVARSMPECDVFVGQSNCSLRSGQVVQKRGGRYVCDRPCAHIRVQDRLLREEFDRQGIPFSGIDPRTIEREMAEYESADAVLVASQFARNSFLEQGFPEERLHAIPYGVDTSRFQPTGEPRYEAFTVLFVGNASLQKGIADLLEAFRRLNAPSKRLILVGSVFPEAKPILDRYADVQGVQLIGAQPQASLPSLMSRCHVLVLPSVHEGFGMVMAEAMACGTPVIASTHSGGPDLVEDGLSGLLVPPADPDRLAEALQLLHDDPDRLESMGQAARLRASRLGNWDAYGDALAKMLAEVQRAPARSNP